VARVKVGAGTELAVNVGRAYQPTTFGFDEETGMVMPALRSSRVLS